MTPRVVLLAGGVGGAKLAAGLAAHLGQELTVVVNTADDAEFHGLLVMPDHDTVMYTLAGLAEPLQGWGIAGETFVALEALERLGQQTWFRLGDRDLATHIARTARLRAGVRLTEVCLGLQTALGATGRILPMTDGPVRTQVRTADGWLPFQDWFVRLHQEPTIDEIRFEGIDEAAATPEVAQALAGAEAIVIGPSNPFVSIGPILGVRGVRELIDTARRRGVPVLAVSPIVAGRALRGPADRMLASLGHEQSATGVARLYGDLATDFVLDARDAALAPEVRAIGPIPFVTDTIMTDDATRARLAADVLDLAARLRR